MTLRRHAVLVVLACLGLAACGGKKRPPNVASGDVGSRAKNASGESPWARCWIKQCQWYIQYAPSRHRQASSPGPQVMARSHGASQPRACPKAYQKAGSRKVS